MGLGAWEAGAVTLFGRAGPVYVSTSMRVDDRGGVDWPRMDLDLGALACGLVTGDFHLIVAGTEVDEVRSTFLLLLKFPPGCPMTVCFLFLWHVGTGQPLTFPFAKRRKTGWGVCSGR